MLRRIGIVLAVAAAGPVLAVAARPQRPLVAVAAALVVAAAVALGVHQAGQVRLRQVADHVQRLAVGVQPPPLPKAGGAQARRLAGALDALAAATAQRTEALVAERAAAQRLLEDLPPAILLFAAGGLSYCNASARRLFATQRRTRTPLQILGVQALADAVAETAATGRPVQVEVARGDTTLLARSSPSGDAVALVVTDLTEVRRLEAVRRDFVTNASHELKTPVAGMVALAESLGVAVRRDPARAQRMVELVEREATRLAQLVHELLDLARLEETAAVPAQQAVDVAGVVRAEAERIAPAAQARGISVVVDGAAPAVVVAQPEDVRLIVANLLENAVQYNRDGGRVACRVRRRGDRVVLTVTDTGIGISSTDRDRVFERFYRVDRARSRAVGGTGLGLAIARHAAQRHGGEVQLDSVLGEGTTVTVTLPVAPPP